MQDKQKRIDDIDAVILDVLQKDARATNAALARELGMAPSAILERIRRLEDSGVIRSYEARLNAAALGWGLAAFIFVQSDEPLGAQETARRLAEIPEVQEVHNVAGEDCYLVKLRVANTEALAALLRNEFGRIGTIRSTRTTIVLETMKEQATVPIGRGKQDMTQRWRLLLAFTTVYLVWGSTYLGIRYAIETIPPLLMAGTRFFVAGTILFSLRFFKTAERPKLRHWRTAAVLGFLLLLCGNGGVTVAEQRVASGMAALLVTSEPLWIVVLNWLRPRGTAPSPREIVGVLMGFGGVVLLLAPQLQSVGGGLPGGSLLWGSLLIVSSALAWAAGSLFGIKAPTVADRPMGNGMTMLAGGAMMLTLGFATGERAAIYQISATSLWAWLYLTVFGSLAAFSAYTFLMRNTTPAKASTYAFVNPVVAVLLGWGLAGEPIDSRSIMAILIIVGAVMLLTLAPVRTVEAVRGDELREAVPQLD